MSASNEEQQQLSALIGSQWDPKALCIYLDVLERSNRSNLENICEVEKNRH
jgi:hypothetical protein